MDSFIFDLKRRGAGMRTLHLKFSQSNGLLSDFREKNQQSTDQQ
jgi:hypothetical protein